MRPFGKFVSAIVWTAVTAAYCLAQNSSQPFPLEGLRLTLTEDLHSALPVEAGCKGLAAPTLNCRVFVVTLENKGKHTVQIGQPVCSNPWITIEVREIGNTNGWFAASHRKQHECSATEWANVRLKPLKPGEHEQYSRRFRGADSETDELWPGTFSARATWMFFACEELNKFSDCAHPVQLTIVSNELKVHSPDVSNVGEIRLAFDVRGPYELPSSNRPGTNTADSTRARSDTEKLIVHYTIRNIGPDPVRNIHLDCGGEWIRPEYQAANGDWEPLAPIPGPFDSYCTLNVERIQEILPGGTAEGDFSFATLNLTYNTSGNATKFRIQKVGEHSLRFTLQPNTCIASADGSFCLTKFVRQKPVTSNVVNVGIATVSEP